jgi:hypothetical protein
MRCNLAKRAKKPSGLPAPGILFLPRPASGTKESRLPPPPAAAAANRATLQVGSFGATATTTRPLRCCVASPSPAGSVRSASAAQPSVVLAVGLLHCIPLPYPASHRIETRFLVPPPTTPCLRRRESTRTYAVAAHDSSYSAFRVLRRPRLSTLLSSTRVPVLLGFFQLCFPPDY